MSMELAPPRRFVPLEECVLQCRWCGIRTRVRLPAGQLIPAPRAPDHGFSIERASVVLRGGCPSCPRCQPGRPGDSQRAPSWTHRRG
jgi:Fe2+ or Zn2+ uptake regulation protein